MANNNGSVGDKGMLTSNETSLPRATDEKEKATEKVSFEVAGMDCADEVGAIKKSLAIEGIISVDANLMASSVSVVFKRPASPEKIKALIEKSGVRIIEGGADDAGPVTKSRIALVAISGFFVGLGMLFELAFDLKVPALVASGIAILTGGVLVFPKAWRALKGLQLDMNVLMTVATVGAFGIGEYSEAATVVFLFSLSELLEAFSVARARRAIREVLDLTPDTAEKINADGKTQAVQIAEIKVGDLVRVKPGNRIPLDGKVRNGGGSVNQAPLTGESLPVEKKVGDIVFAGTIDENGVFDIEVTTIASESKVAKIIGMIEGAQAAKAPSERFVDKFAKIYTPAVFLAAIIALLVPPLLFGQAWDVWVYRSLVLLVVACPCALVLATPVSIVSGLTAMARRGVLVKGGAHLEALGRLKAIAVDKTGTITEGSPKVHEVVLIGNGVEARLLEIALSIELSSSHPLAMAVVNYARSKGVSELKHSDFKNVMGRGAEAVIDGHRYFLGNHRYAHELGVCTPEVEARLAEIEGRALSVIVVGHAPHDGEKGEVLGIIGLGDAVREGAAEAVKAIHAAGVKTIVMLSGDNQKTASAIASQVGIDSAIGDLLPEDKVKEIKRLIAEHGNVAMIGDGINDAPALALASVGIAMGAAGTDTAIETADVALMKDDLAQVAVAVTQGRRALRTIQFNVGFALAIKAVFLVLAVTGYSNLWFAVLADTGASLIVIANAMRLLKVR